MKSEFDILNGKQVEQIVFVKDYFQVCFDHQYTLSVYNDYSSSIDIPHFCDRIVSQVEVNDEFVRIVFGNEYICMNLSN